MSKILLVMRHGDYDYDTGSITEGAIFALEHKAKQFGKYIKIIPDIIIHSPVIRAAESAFTMMDIFNKYAKHNIPTIEQELLHEFNQESSIAKILDIDEINDKHKTIMVVSHSPNIYAFSESITNNGLSTGKGHINMCELELNKWSDIKQLNPATTNVTVY